MTALKLATKESAEALRFLLDFARNDRRRLIERAYRAISVSTRVSTLYAAVEVLHAATSRAEVLSAIEDILVNVIGADQTAIYINDDDAASMTLVSTTGNGDKAARQKKIVARIPMVAGDRSVGAIVIFSLCAFKEQLTATDLELFSMLERHAAIALLRYS